MNTQNLFNILHGKCTLAQAYNYLDIELQKSEQATNLLTPIDKHDVSNYFMEFLSLSVIAYHVLVGMGEIDGTKIYNMANCSHEKENHWGDIGISKSGTYIFKNDWVKL